MELWRVVSARAFIHLTGNKHALLGSDSVYIESNYRFSYQSSCKVLCEVDCRNNTGNQNHRLLGNDTDTLVPPKLKHTLHAQSSKIHFPVKVKKKTNTTWIELLIHPSVTGSDRGRKTFQATEISLTGSLHL